MKQVRLLFVVLISLQTLSSFGNGPGRGGDGAGNLILESVSLGRGGDGAGNLLSKDVNRERFYRLRAAKKSFLIAIGKELEYRYMEDVEGFKFPMRDIMVIKDLQEESNRIYGWICKKPENNEIKWIELKDFSNSKVSKSVEKAKNYSEVLSEVYRLLEKNERTGKLVEYVRFVENNYLNVEEGSNELSLDKKEHRASKKLLERCPEPNQLEMATIAASYDLPMVWEVPLKTQLVFTAENFFNHESFNVQSQARAIIAQGVQRFGKVSCTDIDSERVIAITNTLLDDSPDSVKLLNLKDLIYDCSL